MVRLSDREFGAANPESIDGRAASRSSIGVFGSLTALVWRRPTDVEMTMRPTVAGLLAATRPPSSAVWRTGKPKRAIRAPKTLCLKSVGRTDRMSTSGLAAPCTHRCRRRDEVGDVDQRVNVNAAGVGS